MNPTDRNPGFSIFYPQEGEPDAGAVEQMKTVMADERAIKGALMADHHLGYSMPIGGVVAYENAVSPTGVGFDIGCGNKAVRTNLNLGDFDLHVYDRDQEPGPGAFVPRQIYDTFKPFMRIVQKKVSFGMGRSNPKPVDHELFDHDIWNEIEKTFGRGLKDKARAQLGTVGSGNHYVDLLVDEEDGQLWIANHFGSRGLGHTIASGTMMIAAGVRDSEAPVVLNTDTDFGQFYVEAMELAGDYAYAGRDYVAQQVLDIFGAESTFEVHNHHNFAWLEDGLWVVRKGATPLTFEPAFIGGSMGTNSVIVRAKPVVDHFTDGRTVPTGEIMSIGALDSAPHGAGRSMSRTQAAGKLRKMWYCNNRNCNLKPFRHVGGKGGENAHPGSICPECGHRTIRKRRMRDESTAQVDWSSVRYSLEQRGITVLGAGADEAPEVYKDIHDVLNSHYNIEVLNYLRPIGVVMAGADEFDPYKD
jgi:tRNA-splicing ligase RtcB